MENSRSRNPMPSNSSAADESRQILTAAKAILANDHFVHISGNHGSSWIDIPSWPAAHCPLCKTGVPINIQHAHGQDFLDALVAKSNVP